MAALVSRRDTARAVIVGIVATVAVLSGIGRTRRVDDSLPLSNYPMFTHNPRDTTGIELAIGFTATGGEVRLSPELSGGTVEVIHAAQTITDAVRRREAAALCREIAERVARSDLDDVVAIGLVTDAYEIVDGLRSDDPRPWTRTEHATCEVER